MKFLKFNKEDKKFVKMINSKHYSFELVLPEELLHDILKQIEQYKNKNEDINISWQMKFKNENFIHYKNCIFYEPVDYEIPKNTYFKQNNRLVNFNNLDNYSILKFKKIKVSFSSMDYYSNSIKYKNKIVGNITMRLKQSKNLSRYKDGILLERVMKISNLN